MTCFSLKFENLGGIEMKWKKTTWGKRAWVYTYFHDSSRGSADERTEFGERDERKFGLKRTRTRSNSPETCRTKGDCLQGRC